MRSGAQTAGSIWLTRWGEMPNSAPALLYVARPRAGRDGPVGASCLLSPLLRFFLLRGAGLGMPCRVISLRTVVLYAEPLRDLPHGQVWLRNCRIRRCGATAERRRGWRSGRPRGGYRPDHLELRRPRRRRRPTRDRRRHVAMARSRASSSVVTCGRSVGHWSPCWWLAPSIGLSTFMLTGRQQLSTTNGNEPACEVKKKGGGWGRRVSGWPGQYAPHRYCLCTEGLNSRRGLSCISGSGQGAVDWLLARCAAYRFDVFSVDYPTLTMRHRAVAEFRSPLRLRGGSVVTRQLGSLVARTTCDDHTLVQGLWFLPEPQPHARCQAAGSVPHAPAMFVVTTEEDEAAIRAVYEQRGEFADGGSLASPTTRRHGSAPGPSPAGSRYRYGR